VSDHDNRNERAENGDGERVVVRDRRRIDPVTGEVRTPAGASAGAGPAAATDQATDQTAEQVAGPDAVAAAELAAQVAERTADLQRVSAEYANYRRRVDRDRESVLVGARVQFVSELLTVLDDLDRAEAHGDLTGPFKAVADKLVAVTQKLGLEAFGLEGEPFDPSVHEAVQHEPSAVDGPTVTVVSAVLRRGYRIADRVLRPAMVTVADRPDELGPLEDTASDLLPGDGAEGTHTIPSDSADRP
jgi:molecular chaperone GrpE